MSRRRLSGTVAAGVVLACVTAAVVATAAAGIVAAVAASVAVGCFVAHVRRHERMRRALTRTSERAVLAGTPVRLVPAGVGALVAGLWRPQIYCGRELPATLTDEELRAVVLHERAHQRARDPLRLLALAVVTPVGRLHRRGRAWLQRAVAAREIAADGYALRHGASRAALASALLKVEPLPPGPFSAFASAAELRIRALLADELPAEQHGHWRWAAAGVAVTLAVCVAGPIAFVAVLCCR